jgi:hypothetical protein
MFSIFIGFLAVLAKRPIVFFGGPVIGRNGEEADKGAHIEQEFEPRRHGHPRSRLRPKRVARATALRPFALPKLSERPLPWRL